MPYDTIVASGAAETVMPISWFADHKPEETRAQNHGDWYTAADGGKIFNEGQRILILATSEGLMRSMTYQCVKSSKALGSVSNICRAGNRVIFDDEGSYIEDKTSGERTWMKQVGGMYMLKMWVSRKTTKEAGF